MFVAVSLMMKGKWPKGGTEMKNLLVLLLVFAIVSTASATLVTNGDFTTNMAGWNAAGGGAPWGAEHSTIGGNPGGYAVLWTNTGAWSVWYQVGVEDLNTLGIPVGTYVILQADVNAIGTSLLTDASLKIESWASAKIEELATPVTIASNNTWETHSTTPYLIPSNATALKAVLVSIPTTAAGRYGFDNIEILVPGGTPALRPVPIVGAGMNLANKVISWTNPQGAVNADVYMVGFTELPAYAPNPQAEGTMIAQNTTAQSLTVPSIVANKYYYWVVDVNMAANPAVNVVPGFVWNFQTFDSPPNVNAGADQYLVATTSPMTLTLNAAASDDHGISTYAWTDITAAADKDPATVVTINSPSTEDTTVTLTNTTGGVTGYYQFTLTVTDAASQTAADTVVVGVYGTCAAAAIADPDDPYDGTGDLNGDCKVDLYDFDSFADRWLDCDSLRRTCP